MFSMMQRRRLVMIMQGNNHDRRVQIAWFNLLHTPLLQEGYYNLIIKSACLSVKL